MAKPTGHKTLPDVEAWLTHQGYGFEHETAEAFRRAGFTASLGRTYIDPNSGRPRDIDVVAEVALSRAPAHIYVVAECKASAIGAWVIRESQLPWNEDLWLPISTVDLESELHEAEATIAEMLPAGESHGPTAFAVVEAVDNGDRDAAYSALSQAVSAARGWLVRAATPSIALPIVVVDTPLYTLRYDKAGKADLEEVKQRRVLWPDPGPRSRTAVDIVSRRALPGHTVELRHQLGRLADELLARGLAELGPPADDRSRLPDGQPNAEES